MTADEIAQSMRDEAARLHERAWTLEGVALMLDGQGSTRGAPPEVAPLGYKADGTPYKRKPRSAEANAKMVATRRRNAAAKRKEKFRELDDAHRADLRVVSSLHPDERELEGRELAHTTEGAA